MEASEYKNIYDHQQTLWWYRGMAVILKRLLEEYVPKRASRKILDAGCGTGAAYPVLKQFGTVIGVDVSDNALRFARRMGEQTKKASVMKLPFRKESFDVVVSLDVLYHAWVKNHRNALVEYARVLKPGGVLLWREPAFNWLKSGHELVDFTKRRFTIAQMEQGLHGLPLTIKRVNYINSILFPAVVIKRLPALIHLSQPQAKSDIGAVAPWINSLLTGILSLESYLVTHIEMPFGSSVVCVATKNAYGK